jgi:hypothetical protein
LTSRTKPGHRGVTIPEKLNLEVRRFGAQAPPTRHPRPAPEFLREHLPRDAAAEDKQNAGKTGAIGDARPSAFRPMRWNGQERFDKIPQRIGKQRRSHTRPRYFADEDQVSAVLLHALLAIRGRLEP